MSIRHQDPALHTARTAVVGICECGEYKEEHTPAGPCGAYGCTCRKFRTADLVVYRRVPRGGKRVAR